MATNEQVMEQLQKMERVLCERIDEVDKKATKNDEAIRGNGDMGLKAQVASNSKSIARMERYSQTVLFIVVGELLVRIFGHVFGL
jgi:hypothetical protein